MRRREFLGALGVAAAWPLAGSAQPSGSTARVAILIAGKATDLDLQGRITGLKQGLERLGWKDGGNIQLDIRYGEGRPGRFQPLAQELVALRPNVIVAQTPPVVAAVRRVTRDIPIVFVDVSDPITPGFIETVARPGGNVTGMLSFEAGVVGKWLAMLKEIAPGLSRVMMLGNSKTTAFDYFKRAAESAA
ncbi:MAG: ABC transporter substrate-binding protein, partial [Bradyrhizobium sp.]